MRATPASGQLPPTQLTAQPAQLHRIDGKKHSSEHRFNALGADFSIRERDLNQIDQSSDSSLFTQWTCINDGLHGYPIVDKTSPDSRMRAGRPGDDRHVRVGHALKKVKTAQLGGDEGQFLVLVRERHGPHARVRLACVSCCAVFADAGGMDAADDLLHGLQDLPACPITRRQYHPLGANAAAPGWLGEQCWQVGDSSAKTLHRYIRIAERDHAGPVLAQCPEQGPHSQSGILDIVNNHPIPVRLSDI